MAPGRNSRSVRAISPQVLRQFCVIVALLTLVGCRASVPSDRTTVTFWTISLSPTYDDYLTGLVEQFEREHPGVDLVWIDLPQEVTKQKLMASIAAGDPPDLVNLDTEFALMLAQNGALTDLTGLVTKEQQERYFPNLWQACWFAGGTYAVPWYVTTRVIMRNQRILSQAGLDPERPPATWGELDAWSRQVVERTEAVGQMPAIRIVNDWAMAGAPIIDPQTLEPSFVNPLAVAALDRYRELYRDGVMPPETLTEGYKGALDRYKAGSLAFLEAGPQFLLRIKADAPSVYQATALSPLPQTPTQMVPAATMNFAIPRSSQQRELAVELALFLTSPQAQLEFAKLVPLLPSTVETARDPYFQKGGEDPLLAEAVRLSIEQLPRARDFSLALPRQKDLLRALNDAVERAVRGEVETRQSLEEAAASWQRTLAPFRKESP